MDITQGTGKRYLVHRKINRDGSETVTRKLKPNTRKKVIVARGTGEHTVGAVITSQLLPFKDVMQYQLTKRGFNTSRMKFKDMIPLYYNEFVSNKNNTESPFVPINSYEFSNNPAFKISPSDSLNGDLKDFRNIGYFDNLNGIVDNIVSIFRTAKMKKRYAQLEGMNPKTVMTDEELVQAKAAEGIEKKLENKALNGKALRIGTFKNILIFALVVFILYKYL